MHLRLLAALLLLAAPRTTAAQAWTPNGDGNYTYHMNYSTTALFECGASWNYLGTCAASGNLLTLGNQAGTATMTLTFTGASGNIDVFGDNVKVLIGTVTKTFAGSEQFSFAPVMNDQEWVFGMRANFFSTIPVATQGVRRFRYRLDADEPLRENCCEDAITYFGLAFVAPPAPLRLTHLLIHNFNNPEITLTPESYTITAKVALVPEPSTYALMGAGLLSIAAFTRRRRA